MNSLLVFLPRQVAHIEEQGQYDAIMEILKEYFPEITEDNIDDYSDRLKLDNNQIPSSLKLDDSVVIARWNGDSFDSQTNQTPAIYKSGFEPVHRLSPFTYCLRAKDDILFEGGAIAYKKGDLFYPSGRMVAHAFLNVQEIATIKASEYVTTDTKGVGGYQFRVSLFYIDYV